MVPSPGWRSSAACSSHQSCFFRYSCLPPPAFSLNMHIHLSKGQLKQHILFKIQMCCGFIGCCTMFSISLPIPSLVILLFQAAVFTQLPAQPLPTSPRSHCCVRRVRMLFPCSVFVFTHIYPLWLSPVSAPFPAPGAVPQGCVVPGPWLCQHLCHASSIASCHNRDPEVQLMLPATNQATTNFLTFGVILCRPNSPFPHMQEGRWLLATTLPQRDEEPFPFPYFSKIVLFRAHLEHFSVLSTCPPLFTLFLQLSKCWTFLSPSQQLLLAWKWCGWVCLCQRKFIFRNFLVSFVIFIVYWCQCSFKAWMCISANEIDLLHKGNQGTATCTSRPWRFCSIEYKARVILKKKIVLEIWITDSY